MEMSNPKFSIITVTLNAEKYLRKAIESVLAQNYPNLELIIIDGGSTDSTVDIIKSYANYISYWHSKPDKGANEAYGIGVRKATGDFVAFLNADDWYEKNTFSKVAAAYQQHPKIDVITLFTRIVNLQKNHIHVQSLHARPVDVNLNLKNILFKLPMTNARFFRRTLFNEIGYYHAFQNNIYQYSADRDWFVRLVLHNASNVVVPYLGYTYLAHPGSITMSGDLNRLEKIFIEHLGLADRFLASKKLSRTQTLIFKWWKVDQALRLFALYFKMKKKQQAKKIVKEIFLQFPLKTTLMLMKKTLVKASGLRS